jgi:hypothetical protein
LGPPEALQRRRRWALLAAAATLLALWSWQSPAAEPLPCFAQPGTLAAALCERLRQMQDACGGVESGSRGHCQACLLANHPLACDDVSDSEAAACRRARAAIERCVAYGPARIDSCLRRSLAGMVRSSKSPRPADGDHPL